MPQQSRLTVLHDIPPCQPGKAALLGAPAVRTRTSGGSPWRRPWPAHRPAWRPGRTVLAALGLQIGSPLACRPPPCSGPWPSAPCSSACRGTPWLRSPLLTATGPVDQPRVQPMPGSCAFIPRCPATWAFRTRPAAGMRRDVARLCGMRTVTSRPHSQPSVSTGAPTVSLPPLVEPAAELTRDEVNRYSRHLIIPDVGMSGQKRLKNSKVLIVGAMGLAPRTLPRRRRRGHPRRHRLRRRGRVQPAAADHPPPVVLSASRRSSRRPRPSVRSTR